MTVAIAKAHAREEGDGIRLQTNFRRFDACEHPSLIAALGAHLGLDAEALRKAATPTGGEGPDPRYPELTTLIHAARRDWDRHGTKLVEQIRVLLDEGKLLPMTPANEAALLELFRDHQVRLLFRFSGHAVELPRFDRLVAQGLVDRGVTNPPLIDVAFRLGRGLNMLEVHRVKAPGAPSLESIVRDAMKVELTDRDHKAIDYVRRRGEVFMRRPVEQSTNAAHRALTLVEIEGFRRATALAVEHADGPQELARALRDAASEVTGHVHEAVEPDVVEAMAARTLQNDMERVARTELAFAQCSGAYEALRQQTAAAGIKDPEVYKFVAPAACSDCKRIWGPPANPRRYKLSFVEGREAEGGNFGVARSEWGPCIGPIHPNCTEGPLQFWNEKLVASINRAASEILAAYRR